MASCPSGVPYVLLLLRCPTSSVAKLMLVGYLPLKNPFLNKRVPCVLIGR
jgi:hypothetical protein